MAETINGKHTVVRGKKPVTQTRETITEAFQSALGAEPPKEWTVLEKSYSTAMPDVERLFTAAKKTAESLFGPQAQLGQDVKYLEKSEEEKKAVQTALGTILTRKQQRFWHEKAERICDTEVTEEDIKQTRRELRSFYITYERSPFELSAKDCKSRITRYSQRILNHYRSSSFADDYDGGHLLAPLGMWTSRNLRLLCKAMQVNERSSEE